MMRAIESKFNGTIVLIKLSMQRAEADPFSAFAPKTLELRLLREKGIFLAPTGASRNANVSSFV